MRRSTRSQARHDPSSGYDHYQHQPQQQSHFGGGHYDTGMSGMQMGMGGGMQFGMGGGMQMNPGMMQMPMNPSGSAWHPSPEGFLTMNVASGYQQPQYTSTPIHGYQQQYYGHGDMTGYHQQQQQQSHEEPGPSSGRSLRPRQQTFALPATPGPSSSSAGAAAEKRRRGAGGGGASSSTSKVARSSSDLMETEEMDDDDDEDASEEDDVEVDGQSTIQSSQKKGHKMSSASAGVPGTTLSVDEMVRNGLYYFLLQQHKKFPIKKSDLLKNAMNAQSEQFAEALRKLEAAMKNIFGMKLIRLESSKNNNFMLASVARPEVEEEMEGSTPALPGPSSDMAGRKGNVKVGRTRRTAATECFILVSEYPSNICDSVMRRDLVADTKKTVLYLLLSTIFMLNRSIDEELVWKIITGMQLDQMVCQKKTDLRRFLKSEFVLSGYLSMENPDKEDPTVTRMKQATQSNKEAAAKDKKGQSDDQVPGMKYSWGPRAELEYLKYPMLKFVSSRFGKQPYEFTVQYNMIKRKEMDLIQKDFGEERESDVEQIEAAEGRNGSALQVRQRPSGREAYVIDGENEETETEEEQ